MSALLQLILEMDDLHHILNAVDIAIRQKLVLYYGNFLCLLSPRLRR